MICSTKSTNDYIDIIFVLILSLTFSFIYELGMMRSYENVILDRMMTYFADKKQIEPKLVYLMTTQRSLREAEKFYRMGWPWKRSTYSTIIRTLNEFGVQSITFDAIFTEQSVYTYLGETDDQQLRDALSAHDNVIFANFFDIPENSMKRVVSKQVNKIVAKYEKALRKKYKSEYSTQLLVKTVASRLLKLDASSQQVQKMDKATVLALLSQAIKQKFIASEQKKNQFFIDERALNVTVKDPQNTIPKYYRNNSPILPFLLEAPFLGSVTGFIDEDNTTRRTPLLVNYLDKYYPSLATATLLQYLKPEKILVDTGGIWFDNLFVPLNHDGYFTLKYYGHHQHYSNYNQIDLLRLADHIDSIYPLYESLELKNPIPKKKLYEHSNFILQVRQAIQQKFPDVVNSIPTKIILATPPEAFKGKIVMIGDAVPGHFDLKPTPFSNKEVGAHVHVTVINNILNRDMAIQLRESWYLLACLLALPMLTAFIIRGMSIYLSSLVTLAFVIGIFGISTIAFVYGNYMIDTLTFAMSVILTFPIVSAVNFFKETKQKRYLQSAFGQYLSPKVVKIIVQNPEKLNLGGAKKNVTAFFSDVQGFTKISELLEPEELVSMLNEYLTAMCDIILEKDGVIDKFEGDAIIAFWGAPLDQPQHSILACYSAIEMQHKLMQLREEWKQKGMPQFYMRIGLNTGNAVVGNMGSKQRMDYTMIGDMVNLAARLEGINKFYSTSILISEYTYRESKDGIDTRYLGKVRVVGKDVPIGLYELLSRKNETSGAIADGVDIFHQALDSYEKANFSLAIEQFNKVRQLIPDDYPSQFFIDLSHQYQQKGIPKDWDAVYQLTQK